MPPPDVRPPAAGTAADPETLDLTSPFVNPVYQTLDFQIATSGARLAGLEQQRRQLVDVTKLGGDEIAKLSELYIVARSTSRGCKPILT